jgi:hypothetical protein
LAATLKPKFEHYFAEFKNIFLNNPSHGESLLVEYSRQLIANRINQKMLMLGIERAIECEFRPNPWKFAQLCLPVPEDFGIPNFEDCYYEITHLAPKARRFAKPYVFSHRVVELTYERVGARQYSNGMKDTEFRKIAKTEFDYWVDKAVRDELPDKRPALCYVPASEPKIVEFMKGENRPVIKTGDVNNFGQLRKLLKIGG